MIRVVMFAYIHCLRTGFDKRGINIYVIKSSNKRVLTLFLKYMRENNVIRFLHNYTILFTELRKNNQK